MSEGRLPLPDHKYHPFGAVIWQIQRAIIWWESLSVQIEGCGISPSYATALSTVSHLQACYLTPVLTTRKGWNNQDKIHYILRGVDEEQAEAVAKYRKINLKSHNQMVTPMAELPPPPMLGMGWDY